MSASLLCKFIGQHSPLIRIHDANRYFKVRLDLFDLSALIHAPDIERAVFIKIDHGRGSDDSVP